MKAAFFNDEDADLTTLAEQHRTLIQPRVRVSNGKAKTYWVFPKGAIVEGDIARHIASSGQGAPLDDECKAACGLDPAQLAARQLDYEMTAKGINRPEDRELYRAGVILGYDASLDYIHGPNWDAYHALAADTKEKDTE